MKKYSRILIIVNVVILLGYFNWSVYTKEKTLKDGQLVLMQLAPVDPRSLMQGDYMRLNYNEANSDLIKPETPLRGYAILRTDSNHIGRIVRIQKDLEPIHNNESAIRYKKTYNFLSLGAEAFFFEEGQDSIYNRAVYGGLKIDNKGRSLLVGLYDEDFQLIRPDRSK